ncbi:RICIN domain-containing protein [Bacillus pseudomycoides]|uniref:RICIN domain-containing protein n=1 Tax=Bacillus pseudomycoides TaxID=64104 RepID=UPI0009AB09C5|nr:RICIN domain-containing protein [Bacillus pseudomycoides]PEI85369.1 toxin [Bacillus pseudomycoides]PEM62403.1 toxin [Bacillus pseudomycoides]PHA38323.1 toxin [Bacillus pseudomycoides]PHA46199.1 toxin [Bacillus pseudomycoides]
MKSMSKKIMTGLAAGAMGLSIWAPSSLAATPEKNEYHTIHLAANSNIVWDVFKGWTTDDAGIILWNGDRGDNEQFVFFPLDGGAYAIVNKNSGKPVGINNSYAYYWTDGVRNAQVINDQALKQTNWTGAPAEQWYLRDKGNNNFEIVNQGSGKVASWAGQSITGGYLDYVDLDESNPSDNNKLFNIPAARSTFSLPTLPAVGSRPNAPEYNLTGPIDQQLAQTSNSAVVGASLIPCIMVKDSGASDYTKIHNSPYYVLQKEEYWEKTRSATISPGGTDKYFVKTGVSTVDQQKMTDTLSMNFGVDLGLKFGDQSASIKYGVSKTLQTEVSKTTTNATEETEEKSIPSIDGKETGYTVYQLVTKYTLKRTDGSTVSDPWTVRDKNQIVVRSIAK